MKLNTGPKIIDLGDGVLVEEDVYRIVERVRAYDENLDIIALNPNHQDVDLTDAPYVLVEKCKDGQWRPVANFWQLDESVMAVVESADMNRRDLDAVLKGENAKVRADEQRKYEDLRGEMADIVKHIGGMKSKYTVQDPRTGELIAFYDDRPPERKANGSSNTPS
jgi:hypothetical protein